MNCYFVQPLQYFLLRENSDNSADTETVHSIKSVHLPRQSGDPYLGILGDKTDLALLELKNGANECEDIGRCWPIQPVRLPQPDIQINNGDPVRTLGKFNETLMPILSSSWR